MLCKMAITPEQHTLCDRFGVDPVDAPDELKVGIAPGVREGKLPINAVRHLPVDDTTGWYLWAGEIDPTAQADDFYAPLHVSHLGEWCPSIVPYLALPPGWRVLLASDYEDVWYDETVVVA
jgi:hypothetical protein